MSLYDDPRLAVVYDLDNPDGPDHDYFRSVATRMDARRVVDLGCGTGLLTVTLAQEGRTVTGIDPAPAMLDRAAGRPGGDCVGWRLGTAEMLAPDSADLVIMSGNVSMHIIGDAWHTTLAAVAGCLAPGGLLVFEARNPQAEAWRSWEAPLSERRTPAGRLRESVTIDPPDQTGVLVMHCHNEFPDTGDVVEGEMVLQFRTHRQIEADLQEAGLRLRATHRNWQSDPFTGGPGQPLMVFEAERPTGSTARMP